MIFSTSGLGGAIVIFICVIILLSLFISYFKSQIDEKRLQAISDYCVKNGFQYSEKLTKIPINSKALSVMGKMGHIDQWNAEMYGNRNGFNFYILEHYFVRGSGRYRNQSTDTICILTDNKLDLPQFYIRDEYFLYDDLGKLFGGQDINFEDDPVFSKKFVLQGKSEPSIRRFFNKKIREAFVNNHTNGYVYEGSRDCFAVLKNGKLDVEGRATILSDAIKIFKQFTPPKVDF